MVQPTNPHQTVLVTGQLTLATEAPASGTLGAFAEGTYAITATVTDEAGNATSDTTINELVVDTTAPSAPDS